MGKFNIYKIDMYDDYKVGEVEAGTDDEAIKGYLASNGITDEEEASRYFPVNAERFYCHECNKHFDFPKMVSESRGEFWGMACSETVAYCPHCGGWEFEEVDPKGFWNISQNLINKEVEA